MTANTDFIEMFHELGLSANCSLDEFKRAYRRCVAQLHPDRAANRTADHSRLQRLTVTYEAALNFHKRYGRLPGYVTLSPPPQPSASRSPPVMPERAARRSHLRWLLLLLGVLVLAWLLWDEPPPVDEEPSEEEVLAAESGVESTAALAAAAHPSPIRLSLGMTKDQVRAIEGEPVASSESQWEYGPSWIGFKCGEVEDWYSSPMRPLRFAHAHPTAVDLRARAQAASRAVRESRRSALTRATDDVKTPRNFGLCTSMLGRVAKNFVARRWKSPRLSRKLPAHACAMLGAPRKARA